MVAIKSTTLLLCGKDTLLKNIQIKKIFRYPRRVFIYYITKKNREKFHKIYCDEYK